MTRQSLATAGTLLYGSRWQRPLSRSLRVNDRLVRRWASGEITIPNWVEPTMVKLLQSRLNDIQFAIRYWQRARGIDDLDTMDVTDLDAKCKTSRFDQIPS